MEHTETPDYEPFGPAWVKSVERAPKSFLVEQWAKAGKENARLKEELEALRRSHKVLFDLASEAERIFSDKEILLHQSLPTKDSYWREDKLAEQLKSAISKAFPAPPSATI